MKPNREVLCVKTTDTTNGMVEVHALSPAKDYQTFDLHAITALAESDAGNFDFAFAYRNGSYDLVCLKKAKTTNGFLEVHILSAPDYDTFFLHAETPLKLDNADDFVFRVAQNKYYGSYDLFCLKKNHTDSHFFEVHILDGSKNFQEYALHSTTILTEQDASANFDFQVADYNGDGKADIFCLKTPPGGQFEVHVLDGQKHYQEYALHTGTPISAADAAQNFQFGVADYDADYLPDVLGFKRTDTEGSFELHLLSQRTKYHEFFYQAPTVITAQDATNFIFLPVPDYIPFLVYNDTADTATA